MNPFESLIRQVLGEQPPAQQETRNEAIIRLRNEGKSYGQIARALGIAETVVGGVLTRAGLGKRQKK